MKSIIIFFYQYITSDNVIFLDLWFGRPQEFAPTDKFQFLGRNSRQLRIMFLGEIKISC